MKVVCRCANWRCYWYRDGRCYNMAVAERGCLSKENGRKGNKEVVGDARSDGRK
jgi:hypothetical protein